MAAIEIRWVCKGQQSGHRRCGPSPTVGNPSPEACSRPTQATDGRRPPCAAVRRPRCWRFSGQAAAASPSSSVRVFARSFDGRQAVDAPDLKAGGSAAAGCRPQFARRSHAGTFVQEVGGWRLSFMSWFYNSAS